MEYTLLQTIKVINYAVVDHNDRIIKTFVELNDTLADIGVKENADSSGGNYYLVRTEVK